MEQISRIRPVIHGVAHVLIDRIELTPKAGKLGVLLKGDLTGILALAGEQGKSKLPGSSEPGSELALVAGARSQLYLLFGVEGLSGDPVTTPEQNISL